MIWPNWKQRQLELRDKSSFFKIILKYPQTAKWTWFLGEELGTNSPREALEKDVDEILMAWRAGTLKEIL